jgi:hypothetical protein
VFPATVNCFDNCFVNESCRNCTNVWAGCC